MSRRWPDAAPMAPAYRMVIPQPATRKKTTMILQNAAARFAPLAHPRNATFGLPQYREQHVALAELHAKL